MKGIEEDVNMTRAEKINDQVFEFVEFRIGSSLFGISITNVREIIQPLAVTKIPHAHPNVKGIIQLRGEVLPVIDFGTMTGSVIDEQGADTKYIVSEFTDRTIVFEVCAVTQIDRVDVTEIEKSSNMYEGERVPLSGVIKREAHIVLLVDFEKVLAEQFD